jgi:Flp pilus assembly protein TadG
MKRLTDERGQTIILAALCVPLLLGFVALAVDAGLMFRAEREMQTAADSAAIAGAEEVNFGDVTAAAKADAALNGVTDGQNGATVTVNNPPLSGPNTGNSGSVEVIVSASQTTYFMNVFNQGSMTVIGRAVAGHSPTRNCFYMLGTSGTDISVSNGVNIQIPGCAVFSNSNSSTSLQVTGGATFNAQAINLVGGYTVNNGGHLTPSTPAQGVAPASDPLAYLPVPTYTAGSCLANPNLGWGSHTIGPSAGGTICYNGLTIANGGTATLNPGVYVINGQLNLAGGTTTTGTGVTFYLPPGGSVSISNGITFNLTAPTSGTYNGILFYQDRSNANAVYIEGGASSVLNGILYFPDANLTLENGTNTTSYATVVSKSITFAGGASFKDYSQMPGASSPLVAARLVE